MKTQTGLNSIRSPTESLPDTLVENVCLAPCNFYKTGKERFKHRRDAKGTIYAAIRREIARDQARSPGSSLRHRGELRHSFGATAKLTCPRRFAFP